MRYASVCSGIEAATVAWKPLSWEAAWLSEIEPFPCAVLAHHYPDVPNLGDMTRITERDIERHGRINLLVGGTPCQSFSVAGLRKGLADPRGNLALDFLRLADTARPDWLVWENVPGVLSSNGGRDFGSFLGALAKLGYGFAYRVLDAQYFGLAQRRKRVFVVAHSRNWRRAAAVLFERHSLSGDSPPSREAGPGVAALTSTGVGTCGADDNQAQAGHLIAGVTHPLTARYDSGEDGCGRGTPLIPIDTTQLTSKSNYSRPRAGDPCHPLAAGAHPPAIAFDCKATDCQPGNVSPTMRSMNHDKSHANAGGQVAVAIQERAINDNPSTGPQGKGYQAGLAYTLEARQRSQAIATSAVRRLTPRECERLQGFPDDYTLVTYRNKPAADGPRYKALGNSMAVPVIRWLGERIEQVEAIDQEAHQ